MREDPTHKLDLDGIYSPLLSSPTAAFLCKDECVAVWQGEAFLCVAAVPVLRCVALCCVGLGWVAVVFFSGVVWWFVVCVAVWWWHCVAVMSVFVL